MHDELHVFLDGAFETGQSLVVKRLTANDTGATKAHQAGPYIPKAIAFKLHPALKQGGVNPDVKYDCYVASHQVQRINRFVWYTEGSRDECRITRWSTEGKKNSVLQPSLTGSIVVFSFLTHPVRGIERCSAWFCQSEAEEEIVEARCGVIEPGTFWFKHENHVDEVIHLPTQKCSLKQADFPDDWLSTFPDASAIIRKTLELMPAHGKPPDSRLVLRRDCEYAMFKAIENVHVMPEVQGGFKSIDAFIALANSVTNRRKSRSGRSLELHLKSIFDEDSVSYSHGAHTEGKKTPDFLFPSSELYHDLSFPGTRLRMLGVKTTCKDRWRQVISEADRIPQKHLATLQEGVSVPQFEEMADAGITLVVPKGLHRAYPKEIRHRLLSLEQFIAEVRT